MASRQYAVYTPRNTCNDIYPIFSSAFLRRQNPYNLLLAFYLEFVPVSNEETEQQILHKKQKPKGYSR